MRKATPEFAPLLTADHFSFSSYSSNYSDPFLSHKAELEASIPNFQSGSNAEYSLDFSYDELERALIKV